MSSCSDEKLERTPSPSPSPPPPTTSTTSYSDVVIETEQLGVYRLLLSKTAAGFSFGQWWEGVRTNVPVLRRLFGDIYQISPKLFVFYVLAKVWQGVEEAVLIHFTSQMLRTIEEGLRNSAPDARAILSAVFARMLCAVLVALLTWFCEQVISVLRSRIMCHFNIYIMRANLRIDLPTSLEPSSRIEGTAVDASNGFEDIARYFTEFITTLSQVGYILHLSRSSGGSTFALICITRPLYESYFNRSMWNKICFAYVTNVHFMRMKALELLSSGTYRADVISGGLNDWIVGEYHQSFENLGHASIEHVWNQYEKRPSPFFDIMCKVLGDLPMVYCAISAIYNPSKFTVASIAVLYQASTQLRLSLDSILRSNQEFNRSVATIKNVYASAEIENQIVDGTVDYPQPQLDEKKAESGMSFELRNVSFAYPGSQQTSSALNNINLSIKAGQLVIIVGSNGSGKSTITKILSRLYDPTSGELYIDGLPAQNYKMATLHRASVILSQDNLMYPLSLAENIGLGYCEKAADRALIEVAARRGGAADVIGKFKEGYETVLEPQIDTFEHNLYGIPDHPLNAEMEKIAKRLNISGGERQRVVASRAFMRLQSDKIKFVAVDEPSSALDAEGELQLFEQLLAMRKGRTMVFVTHRFGHLTKRADLIVCMKDGAIVEAGDHDRLMRLDGEYAKLYNIQASAFVSLSRASTPRRD